MVRSEAEVRAHIDFAEVSIKERSHSYQSEQHCRHTIRDFCLQMQQG